MTEKNRERLRQFVDPRSLNSILTLPEEILAEVKAKGNALSPVRAAALVETALAVELLTMTVLRVKNLAMLSLEQNIQWSRSSKRSVCHLVVDRRHVKNRVDRDYELEGHTQELLRIFIDVYRLRLVPPNCPWLFARRDGIGHVDPVVLSTRIKRVIRQRTGLIVNPHLFRSLGAKIYLDSHPGAYEVMRLVLGHKSLSTTTSAYTGMESISAAKQFDRIIMARRDEARAKRERTRSSAAARR
jgi:integrase